MFYLKTGIDFRAELEMVRTVREAIGVVAGVTGRKAPKHALADIRDDFHRIVYAANADTARTAYAAFERTWNKRCPGVVTSLREGGDELLAAAADEEQTGGVVAG